MKLANKARQLVWSETKSKSTVQTFGRKGLGLGFRSWYWFADKIMHSIDDMTADAPKTNKTIMNEKLANCSPQKAFANQEEVWDRTPILSSMNSMECWDYTIELECLNGPQGYYSLYIKLFPSQSRNERFSQEVQTKMKSRKSWKSLSAARIVSRKTIEADEKTIERFERRKRS